MDVRVGWWRKLSAEELMLLNCGVGEDSWESLGLQGDPTGWDGWMAPPTRWTWVWVDSWSWWWTGRPGVLRFMGSQRVGHNWVTELNWTEHISRVEAPILWSPDVKSWLIGKDPDAGKDWGQEEKGAAENEIILKRGLRDGSWYLPSCSTFNGSLPHPELLF